MIEGEMIEGEVDIRLILLEQRTGQIGVGKIITESLGPAPHRWMDHRQNLSSYERARRLQVRGEMIQNKLTTIL